MVWAICFACCCVDHLLKLLLDFLLGLGIAGEFGKFLSQLLGSVHRLLLVGRSHLVQIGDRLVHIADRGFDVTGFQLILSLAHRRRIVRRLGHLRKFVLLVHGRLEFLILIQLVADRLLVILQSNQCAVLGGEIIPFAGLEGVIQIVGGFLQPGVVGDDFDAFLDLGQFLVHQRLLTGLD